MTSSRFEPLLDNDAALRELASSDLPLTLDWRNHSDSRGWFHSTELISPQQHAEWFSKYLHRSEDFMFILEVAGVPVGQSSLYGIVDGTAEFGRLLVDPGQRGRGLSHRVIDLTLRAADEVLNLDQVYLEVKRDNARAIRSYRVAGFHEDGARLSPDHSIVMVRDRP